MKLGKPRDIEADFIGVDHLLDGFAIARGLGLFRSAGKLVEKAEFHKQILVTSCYCAADPPSIVNTEPVTHDDSGPASQRTAAATSSGVPRRLIGICAR